MEDGTKKMLVARLAALVVYHSDAQRSRCTRHSCVMMGCRGISDISFGAPSLADVWKMSQARLQIFGLRFNRRARVPGQLVQSRQSSCHVLQGPRAQCPRRPQGILTLPS
ncbi:unnamed protein product [Prorocentrum cordatum]|uniref:Uncharacterized protein n=1 Tax=Prorocentrum cordatum TaxID=2364126 RepID=A0ABN9XUC3_9DINO|nr:unnamed protein product [Polarella glacialis]